MQCRPDDICTLAVQWNPHEAMPDCYRKFACVENAQFVSPVRLNPAEDWRAEQELTVIDL